MWCIVDIGELLIPPGSISFDNLFPLTEEIGGGNYDFFYQNSIRKFEYDLGH